MSVAYTLRAYSERKPQPKISAGSLRAHTKRLRRGRGIVGSCRRYVRFCFLARMSQSDSSRVSTSHPGYGRSPCLFGYIGHFSACAVRLPHVQCLRLLSLSLAFKAFSFATSRAFCLASSSLHIWHWSFVPRVLYFSFARRQTFHGRKRVRILANKDIDTYLSPCIRPGSMPRIHKALARNTHRRFSCLRLLQICGCGMSSKLLPHMIGKHQSNISAPV